MRLTLTIKWMLTLLLTSLVGVALVGFFAYWTTVNEFDRFRNEQAELAFIETAAQYYQKQGSWDGIHEWLFSQYAQSRPPQSFPPRFYAIADMHGRVVSPFGFYDLNAQVTDQQMVKGIPILVDGVQVGIALNAEPPPGFDPREQAYLDKTNRALIIGAIGASAVALLIGLLLSRQFLYPLTELTQAIASMKAGDLQQQVPVHTADELGELAETFNQMSVELHRANQLRQQMTADIAHDLRTPLQVIGGYIEVLRDGVLPPTPERFDAMNHEVQLLRRLVDDLRTLSLADAKALKLIYQEVAPRELLQQVKDTFEPITAGQDVTIQIDASHTLPSVQIDRERMLQVLTNLVSNALRYTAADGTITLLARPYQNKLQLLVQDTGTGIPQDKLANIFERFYRVDVARQEIQGESGLGLAIVKSIVEAHGGTVQVSSEIGKGTTFTITLPV